MNLNLSADNYVGLQWDSGAQKTNFLFANFSRSARVTSSITFAV